MTFKERCLILAREIAEIELLLAEPKGSPAWLGGRLRLKRFEREADRADAELERAS
jgi:hypothetical protein